jgi:hypothetical protein
LSSLKAGRSDVFGGGASPLAAGFSKENLRHQLGRGLVFETGPEPVTIDNVRPSKTPSFCIPEGAGLTCPK